MKTMIKQLLVATMFTMAFVLVPAVADAQSFLDDINRQTDSFAGEQGVNAGEATDPRLMIGRIIRYGLGAMGTVFMGYIVFAGYLFLTAAGNDDQVARAKKILQNSVLGVIITLSAYSITVFITRWEQQRLSPGRNSLFQDEQDFNSCDTNFADPASCP